MNKLTHLDENGAAQMVDVSAKAETDREAVAEATITISADAFAAITTGTAKKGDVLAVARIAGIMAAKKTSDLIPLCHPLALTGIGVDFETNTDSKSIRILATCKSTGQTGVEMEALTAASIAALTIYDMIKAIDKAAVISGIRLVSKSGGKSGDFVAPAVKENKPAYRSAGMHGRVKPVTLMGEVAAPRAPADTGSQRDAFRAFMTSNRLRATQWAKDAGVPVQHIYSFLTGRARAMPSEVADKLARVAKSRVEDMFR
jgi:cyclic pyranopterin monophosphate synthase